MNNIEDTPVIKCVECRNKNVCKFMDEMTLVQTEANKIKYAENSPIGVTPTCDYYEKMAHIQNNIIFRVNEGAV